MLPEPKAVSKLPSGLYVTAPKVGTVVVVVTFFVVVVTETVVAPAATMLPLGCSSTRVAESPPLLRAVVT